MNNHVFVFDGVRHRGDVRNLIRSAEGYVAGFPNSKTVWLARPDQAQFLTPRQIIGTASESDSYESLISRWITDASQNGAAGSVFHVLSYNVDVLRVAAALNDASCVVATEHLGKFRDGGCGSQVPGTRPAPPLSSGVNLSPDEAVDVAKRVLREGGHTSSATAMHQPQLRIAMGRLDPRARRNHSDPNTWSLVRILVARGLGEGWLRQERRGGIGYEYIWLVEPPQSESPLNDMADSPQAAVPAQSIGPLPVAKPKRREAVMEEALRSERIGSPPIPRKHLFDAVESVVAETAERPMTVAELQGQVCARAQAEAAAAGYQKEQHWDAICECVFHAMLQAQVLVRPDGTPVPAKIGQHSSLVGSLVEGLRQRTEALMVERVIQKLGDVRLVDAYPLGLAMYQQGRENAVSRENLLAKIDDLLSLLEKEGRIEVQASDLIVAIYR